MDIVKSINFGTNPNIYINSNAKIVDFTNTQM